MYPHIRSRPQAAGWVAQFIAIRLAESDHKASAYSAFEFANQDYYFPDAPVMIQFFSPASVDTFISIF